MFFTQVLPLQLIGIPFGVQEAKAVIAYEQEGFRFRDDNGSETTASWLDTQDTNITRDINTNTRLRMLINTTDDSPSNQYQLEYKKSTDGTYNRVIKSLTAPEIESSSSNSYTAAGSFTLSHTVRTGQKLAVLVHAMRVQETAFTLSATYNGDAMTSAGSISTTTTSRNYVSEIFYLNTPDVGTADVVVTPSLGSTRAVVSAHSLVGFTGTIGDTGSNTAGCTASVDTVQANSLILTASTQRSNNTPPTMSPSGSNAELYELASGSANTEMVGAGYSLTTTSTGSYTGGSTCSGTIGDIAFAAEFRFDTTQPAINLSLSSNITASGANTTAQLTAPSGKTTGDFVAGRIQDDENPADAVNITINDYTELEWSLTATSTAVAGDIYQFRVTVAGTALDTYTVTPQWTIPSPTLTQNDWRIYVNNDAIDPTDPWPSGGSLDLAENEALTTLPYQNDAAENGDVYRLRMSIAVTTTTLSASGEGFILAYAEETDCTAASSWTDVDASGGGGTWRFYNSSVTDGATITTRRLGVSDVSGRVSESDPTSTNPNAVTAGQDLEWDWVIQYNGASEAHSYCFRIERDDGTTLNAYNSDSYPKIETRPGVTDQMRHGNFYSTNAEKGFYWVEDNFESAQVANAASTSGSASSLTLSSFNVASNPNRILVCGTAVRGAVTVSSITWNGGAESFTKINDNQPGSDVRTELWYLLNPTATTANIVITFSGSQSVMGGCVSIFNAAQSAPTGSAEASGSDATPTVNVTTVAGDLVIDIMGDQSGGFDIDVHSSQAERWQIEATNHDGGMSTEVATGTTTTMSWSETGSDFWSIIAVPIKKY